MSGDFAAMADDDGNYFFDIRTRTPGTYILAEKAVQETVSAAVNSDSPQLKAAGNQTASDQQSTQPAKLPEKRVKRMQPKKD